MKVTRRQLRKYLSKQLLKENQAVKVNSVPPLILTNNSAISRAGFDKVVYIPYDDNSNIFLKLISERNGTDFGNRLEPIIANVMKQDGYAGTGDLNIGTGEETVLADIKTPASNAAVQSVNPETVLINDVWISAKASADYFDMSGANAIKKLPKLINQAYPNNDVINGSNVKTIKCKLGAAFAGGHFIDTTGKGYKDELGARTIVPIGVKLYYPTDHNLAIVKGFTEQLPNTDANKTIYKDMINDYVLGTFTTDSDTVYLNFKSDVDIKKLMVLFGRLKIGSIAKLDTVLVSHNKNAIKNINKFSPAFWQFLTNPHSVGARNLPPLIGRIDTSIDISSQLDDLNPFDDPGTFQTIIEAAKSKTTAIINNAFAPANISQYITAKRVTFGPRIAGYFNGLGNSLNLSNTLADAFTDEEFNSFIEAVKNKLINMSDNYFNTSFNDVYTNTPAAVKSYYAQRASMPGVEKSRHAGFTGGSGATPPALEVERTGTSEAFILKASAPGEEGSPLNVYTISGITFYSDVTKSNPSSASAFGSTVFENDSGYEVKDYLILFQAGNGVIGEMGATLAIAGLSGGVTGKATRPVGRDATGEPEPIDPQSQPSDADIVAVKASAQTLKEANNEAIKTLEAGQSLLDTDIQKIHPDYQQRMASLTQTLAAGAAQKVLDYDLLRQIIDIAKMQDPSRFEESYTRLTLDSKALRKIILELYTGIDNYLQFSKYEINFVTNYYKNISKYLKAFAVNPTNETAKKVLDYSDILLQALNNTGTKLINPKKYNFDIQPAAGLPDFTIPIDKEKDIKVNSFALEESRIYENILKELLKYTK